MVSADNESVYNAKLHEKRVFSVSAGLRKIRIKIWLIIFKETLLFQILFLSMTSFKFSSIHFYVFCLWLELLQRDWLEHHL